MRIVRESVSRAELQLLAENSLGDYVKAVVDVDRGLMAIDGDLHADEERLLLEDGSEQTSLWGINLYPGREGERMVEYDSMINVRPYHGNRSRGIDSPETRARVAAAVRSLVNS